MPIYQRGNSYLVSVGSRENRYKETFRTLKEAEVAELEALARQKASGSPLKASRSDDQSKPRGYTLLDAYRLTWRERWSQDKAKGTHEDNCRTIFRVIPEDTLLKDITPDMVLDAIEIWEDEGNTGSTINRKISHINTMLSTAQSRGWVIAPKLPRRKEGQHRIRFLSESEEGRVLWLCDHLNMDELRDFIIVAIDTGFRRGELLGLIPQDFIGGKLHLHPGQTKTDKGRAVPVTKRVEEVLLRRSNGHKVFTLNANTLRTQWGNLRTAMDKDTDPQFVVHMLRHTCASRLVQRGVPLKVVQEWMGHSTIMTTMRYAHLSPDSLLEAKAALERDLSPGQRCDTRASLEALGTT